MIIERIKQMTSKNKFLKLFIGIFILIFFVFYFKIFFTKGTYFYGIFLKKEVVASENHYIGNSRKGSIQVIVKGQMKNQNSVDVIYILPNRNNQQYTVNFNDVSGSEISIQNIKDKSGKIIFSDGVYSTDNHYLFSKDGQPIFGTQVLINGESHYNTDYIVSSENEVSLSNVVSFAASKNDMVRGKYQYLVPAIFLFIVTLIDIRFPLFLFTLRNFLDVKDPEPSDFYITMQRKFWCISPIIGIILMIIAIF